MNRRFNNEYVAESSKTTMAASDGYEPIPAVHDHIEDDYEGLCCIESNLATNSSLSCCLSKRTSDSSLSIQKMTKLLLSTCLVVGLVQLASAWGVLKRPSNAFQRAAGMASIAAIIVTTTLPANAAVDFTGSYADPFHPNCLREIVVDGPKASLSGTDGNPGCPADGSGKAWSLVGKVDDNNILVDFTPKGGPKDLKGVWEPSPVPGIRWPDGNLWSLKTAAQ